MLETLPLFVGCLELLLKLLLYLQGILLRLVDNLILVVATVLHLLVLDSKRSLNVLQVSSRLLELLTEHSSLILCLPAFIGGID